jgi:hypothetical protein
MRARNAPAAKVATLSPCFSQVTRWTTIAKGTIWRSTRTSCDPNFPRGDADGPNFQFCENPDHPNFDPENGSWGEAPGKTPSQRQDVWNSHMKMRVPRECAEASGEIARFANRSENPDGPNFHFENPERPNFHFENPDRPNFHFAPAVNRTFTTRNPGLAAGANRAARSPTDRRRSGARSVYASQQAKFTQLTTPRRSISWGLDAGPPMANAGPTASCEVRVSKIGEQKPKIQLPPITLPPVKLPGYYNLRIYLRGRLGMIPIPTS